MEPNKSSPALSPHQTQPSTSFAMTSAASTSEDKSGPNEDKPEPNSFPPSPHEARPASTTFAATPSPKPKLTRGVSFKKTHRRNESKLSRISHLRIRSLRGDTIDEETEFDGNDDEAKKPIYLFESLTALCPWMPRMSLPG